MGSADIKFDNFVTLRVVFYLLILFSLSFSCICYISFLTVLLVFVGVKCCLYLKIILSYEI